MMPFSKILHAVNHCNDDGSLTVYFLILLAGAFAGIKRRLSSDEAFERSVFRKWNKRYWLKTESWVRRFSCDVSGSPLVVGYNSKDEIQYKRRFWGSDSFLLMLSDGWNHSKFLQELCIAAAICVAAQLPFNHWAAWVVLFSMRAAISLAEDVFFNNLLKTKTPFGSQ